MENEKKITGLQRITLSLFLGCLVVFIMIVGKGFLVPLAWALLISFSSIPFLERVQDRIRLNWGLLTSIHLLLLMLVIVGILYFFYYEVSEIIINVPQLDSRLVEIEENLIKWLAGYGINIRDSLNFNYITSRIAENTDAIFDVAGGVGKEIGNIFLILIYSFFIIYYKDVLPRFYEIRVKNKEKITEIQQMLVRVIGIISNYLSGTLLMTLGLGVIIYIFLLILGIEYALFFAVFVSVLNLVPYIGNPIGIVIVFFYTILTKDGVLIPLLVVAALFLANFIQENLLRPLIVGDKLRLNAFMVFFSVILGSAIWGVSGMVLFIPVAGIIKIILESREETRAYALFFGETDEKSGLKWNLFSRKSPAAIKKKIIEKSRKSGNETDE